MIKIWVTTNDDKIEDVVATSMTPKDVFAKHGVNYANGQSTLDGCILTAAQLNTPLSELDVGDEVYLASISKHDNATGMN
jgi:hypothetical protein